MTNPDRAPSVRAKLSSVTVLEWFALVAGLLPVLVSVTWALATGWVPLGDSGQLTVRSRDVLTSNHPLLGAWSSASQSAGTNLNNFGSLYNEMLAPFTRASPYAGTAVGMTVINGACVVVAWLAARSSLGRRGAVVAMASTAALVVAMGCVTLLQTRQQVALLLPFWALLWVVAAVVAGRTWAIPVAAFLASLLVQTHFSFVLQGATLFAIVAVRVAVAGRRPLHSPLRRPLVATAVVFAACWAQPVWDQFFGTHNLRRVLTGDPQPGPGLQVATNVVVHRGLAPPFWARSLSDANQPFMVAKGSLVGTWLPVLAWAAILALLLLRTRRRPGGAFGIVVVAAVLLPTLLVVSARIPSYLGGFPPQNYYWMWPASLFLSAAVVLAVTEGVDPSASQIRPQVVSAGLATVLAVATIAASVPTSRVEYLRSESFEQSDLARGFLDDVRTDLRDHPISGPVVVDYSRDLALSQHRYTFLAELQRAGVPFTFDDEVDVHRFGLGRCADGRATTRLFLYSGDAAGDRPPDGARVVARLVAPKRDAVVLVAVAERPGRPRHKCADS
ncbi:hypothetical protein BH10ACT1_BH10ACT1_02450 [soil metagenome]